MKTLNIILIIITIIIITVFSTFSYGQVSENFDAWNDGSYGSISTYDHNGVGQWETYNSVCDSQNARSGKAVRFNDDSGENEYLLFKGIDGNGKDSGIGTISFWYSHWDGDGRSVQFQVQYNQNGGGWTNIGSVVSVTSTTYTEFSATPNISGDNILIKVISIDDAERLLIDDFSISDYAGSSNYPDWCNLQSPASGNITEGGSFDVYAQIYEAGVTNAVGQGSGIQAWIGYSTSNSDPSTWTDWVPATYNTDVSNNDEYMADIGTEISSAGTYYYASKFTVNGTDYSYGGYNSEGGGFWGGSNVSGILTVNACPTLSAPVATNAVNIDETEFTATWNAVAGADGYYLDIYGNF